MAETPAFIRLSHVFKIFGRRPEALLAEARGLSKAELLERRNRVMGLRDVSLDIAEGHIQVVMGLSGSGKSTLIRHINRLVDPTAGEVVVDGTDVCALSPGPLRDFRRAKTAMVFQRFALLPHRTVLGNVVFGLEVRGMPERARLETAHRWIARVGLEGFEKRYPSQLSGGMQQRVGLARALANDAPILLMDEAFSALDPLIRVDMQTMLLELQEEVRKTVVFITHDLDEALRLGDRIAIMQDGELVQQGTPQEIVLQPANGYVESFVRQVNRGRVLRVAALAGPAGAKPAALRLNASLTLADAVREMVQAGQDEADLAGPHGEPAGRVRLPEVMREIVRT